MISPALRYRILTGLRKAYFMSEERKKALTRCEVASPAMKLDGTPKLRAGKPCFTRRYTCELCGEGGLKAPKEFQVDHIDAVGGAPGTRDTPKWWTWSIYMSRLFVPSVKMQGVCKKCHAGKTLEDKADMRSGKFYANLVKVYNPNADK